MARLAKYSSKERAKTNKNYESVVENFMGGNSFTVSPLQTLKIVAASSIFGEPQYYRAGLETPSSALTSLSRGRRNNDYDERSYEIFSDVFSDGKSAVDVFTSAIDKALD